MRIFFDENFSPHLVAGLRALQNGMPGEGVEVCSVVEEFGRGALDEDWIPKVGAQGGVAITQDCNIHRTRAQWAICQGNQIGVFFFKPPKKQGWNYWMIVQVVIRHWEEIKRLATNKKPFGFVIEPHMNKLKSLG
jgi:hypothetical protein